MSSNKTSKSTTYNCAICKDVFTRNSSLKRHIAVKHKDNDKFSYRKTGDACCKMGDDCRKTGDECHSKETDDNDTKNHRCHLCYKNLSSNSYLLKHIKKCKGVKNRLQCEFCEKEFKHEKSRFHHYKICSTKKELDISKSEQHTINNSGQINNLTNGIQNINNNNNFIIVYKPTGNTPFTTDHLTAEDFKKILKLAEGRLDNRAMGEYSKQMFENEKNRCVTKSNLKSGNSRVHVGNDTWQIQLDKNVYPQLALDMANTMSEYVDLKRETFNKEMYIRLRDFVDCMCDAGYINPEPTSREKEFQKEFKLFMDGLKLIVYGNTKK